MFFANATVDTDNRLVLITGTRK